MKLSLEQLKLLHENDFEIKVKSPFGMQKITDFYEKFSTGIQVVFNDGSDFIGADYHLVLKDNEFVPLISLNHGDIIQSENNAKVVVDIIPVQEQRWLDFSVEHESQTYIQSGIIHHNSGKSSIIYSICRYLNDQGLKGLLIVPNLSLINQMYGDFIDYSSANKWDVEENVHKIFAGQDKQSDKLLSISTWQSLMTIGKTGKGSTKNAYTNSYFEQFDYVICDECHGLKATEITKIVEQCTNASYRIGLTGTTGKTKANINTIIGLTGPINDLITTKELIERKEVADFDIKCLVLKYDEETSKIVKKLRYQDEIKYLVSNKKRNNFIKNLAISMKSNSIVLFNFIEHGKLLHKMISESKFIGDRNVYLIYGGIDGDERERIRHIVETEQNAIIIASIATTGTGVSIKNLHNIIFCLGTKSSIRILQAIGRAIRLHDSKEKATIYDIVDNLTIKKHQNFAVKHFLERVKVYNEQQFNYKIKNIPFDQE